MKHTRVYGEGGGREKHTCEGGREGGGQHTGVYWRGWGQGEAHTYLSLATMYTNPVIS